MAWTSFVIQNYEANLVAHNTPGYPGIYGYIRLYWQNARRATLWFYRDSVSSIADNASFESGGVTNYYGRFGQAQFHDSVDFLRNEKPVSFWWNDESKGVFLSTGQEPVGEAELP
jgi:hypothetical protein